MNTPPILWVVSHCWISIKLHKLLLATCIYVWATVGSAVNETLKIKKKKKKKKIRWYVKKFSLWRTLLSIDIIKMNGGKNSNVSHSWQVVATYFGSVLDRYGAYRNSSSSEIHAKHVRALWEDCRAVWCYLVVRKLTCMIDMVKGKAIPLQAWAGPEGSRGLRLPDFKTVGTWRW